MQGGRRDERLGDAAAGPGDLGHPGDAGARAVPAAGGAGGQAAGAGGVHHAAAVAAAGRLGVGPRRGPAHHERHDVRSAEEELRGGGARLGSGPFPASAAACLQMEVLARRGLSSLVLHSR